MTSSKTRAVARMLEARHGIKDDQMAYEIVQLCLTPDSPAGQNGSTPYRWGHPAIKAAKEITRASVPEIMVDDIIAKLGDSPDIQRARACYRRMVTNTGKPGAWWWLDDYAAGRDGSSRQQATAFKPAAVYEWSE